MKHLPLSSAVVMALAGLLTLPAQAEPEKGKSVTAKTLSASEVKNISDRMRQTSEQMRLDLKKARIRFEVLEAERKQQAERARQQAIKENALRQAQLAAQARERKFAAQAQAQREREEAEQARLQAERAARKKQLMLTQQANQNSKESEAASIQARKEKAAEALRKARASVGVKAFGE